LHDFALSCPLEKGQLAIGTNAGQEAVAAFSSQGVEEAEDG
jgi:hypothetical protein